MTTEEKNNLMSYLKQYKKKDTDENIILSLMFTFSITMLIFAIATEPMYATVNFITLLILLISIFVIFHKQKQLSENIFLLLKDYNVITINKELIKTYNKEDIINAAKNNKTIDLSTNNESSISQEIDARYISAIELLKQYPDLKSIKKVKNTYTINELILDYQKDIIKICNEKIPNSMIEYETTEPIGKAKLRK